MILDRLLALIEKTDSYKKVVLLLLTSLTGLVIYVVFRVSEVAIEKYKWNSIPIIYDSHSECSVIEVREGVFIVSLAFPVPTELSDKVFRYSVGFWIKERPSYTEVRSLCNSLIRYVSSERAEELLAPHLKLLENEDRRKKN